MRGLMDNYSEPPCEVCSRPSCEGTHAYKEEQMVGPIPGTFSDAREPQIVYCISCDVHIGGIARPGMVCPFNPDHVLVDFVETMKTAAESYDPIIWLSRGLRTFT